MTAFDQLAFLRDERLSAHATSALPAWLWADGATEILWANPTGAAIFGAATPATLAGRRFQAGDPAARQIASLANSLPLGGAARLERLRGFGAGVGRMLICSCARIALSDGRSAILVAAGAPAGPSLPLAERVRRLFAGIEGPIAVFSREGALLQAGAEATQHLGDVTDLAAAGAGALAAEALANGRATGGTALGALMLERIGSGTAAVLLATFRPPATATEQPHEAEPPVTASEHMSLGEDAAPPPHQPMGEEATHLPDEPTGAETASPSHEPMGEEATSLLGAEPAAPELHAAPDAAEAVTGAAEEIVLGSAIESPPATDPVMLPLAHAAEADPVPPAIASVAADIVATPETEHAAPAAAAQPVPMVDVPAAEQPVLAPEPAHIVEPAFTETFEPAHQPVEAANSPPLAPPSEEPIIATAPDHPDAPTAAEPPAAPHIEAPLVEAIPAAACVAPERLAPASFPERHHPLRFVWQTDADQRFTVGSEDFMDLLGPGVAALFGRPWGEITADLGLDPEGRIAHALGSRDTWSGITVAWPVDGAAERLIVELSGLPTFDRDRAFRGYRGFGVCRDLAAMNAVGAARRMTSVALVEMSPAPVEVMPEPVEALEAVVETQPTPVEAPPALVEALSPSVEAPPALVETLSPSAEAPPALVETPLASVEPPPVLVEALEAAVNPVETLEAAVTPVETPEAVVHVPLEPVANEPLPSPDISDPAPTQELAPPTPVDHEPVGHEPAPDSSTITAPDISPPPVDVAPEAIIAPPPVADTAAPSPSEDATPSPPEPTSHETASADTPAATPPVVDAQSADTPSADAPAAASAEEQPAPEPRPQLTLVPPAKNIVPFRSPSAPPADRRPVLTPVERTAFQEIAKALGARVEGAQPDASTGTAPDSPPPESPAPESPAPESAERGVPASLLSAPESAATPAERPPEDPLSRHPVPSAYAAGIAMPAIAAAAAGKSERAVLDRVPVAVLVYRGERLLYANSTLLDWTGYEDLDAIVSAGGLDRLFTEPGVTSLGVPGGSGKTFALTTRRGDSLPVEGRMFSVTWAGETALLTVLTSSAAETRARAAEQALQTTEERLATSEQAIEDLEERVGLAEKALRASEERLKISDLSLRAAEAATRELESVLDTATDGVIVVNRDGVVLASNRSAEALFGYESRELASRAFVDLFAPESHRAAHDYLTGLTRPGVASVLNDGREVIGRVAQGGLIPLFMTIGRIADGTDKFCAVFRDITQWKRAEEDLTNAKREAEKASSAKSDFLAKVSHEIRTPMNAIIGFSEVMMEERFGAVGNDRYKQYLKDIHTSGEHVISLVNDLLDLSKIEAGKLELNFARVDLNDVVRQCVAIMQPQANRERIIIRTSLSPTLPAVVADERSVRQIVLNLLSNSIKFTGAGGQVIVSTALTDLGEEVLRVRDTGVGMTEKELSTALEPFRQVATAGRTGPGTGLGLPLTKALAEANRASFTIKSAVDAGTLVEIAFPANRVLAE